MNDLKKNIIDLLEKDKEFRYTIAGLIGYKELLDRIVKIDERLAEFEERITDRFAKIDERVVKVEERLLKVEERLADLEERVVKVEERLADLEERLLKVEERLADLEERVVKVEERLLKVEERLVEHDKKFNAIIEELRDLRRVTNEHSKILGEHTKLITEVRISVGSLGRRMGRDMEKMVLNIYKDQLLQLGIDPSNVKRFRYIDSEGKYGLKGKEYEFDIVISNEHADVLEVKAYTNKEDLEWFDEKVSRVRSEFPKKVRRKVIITIHVDIEALDRSKDLNVDVIYGNIIYE